MVQQDRQSEYKPGYLGPIVSLIMKTGGITQAELAREIGISGPTLIANLKVLRERNLLDESEKMVSKSGRRPRYIRISGDSHYTVGVLVRPERYLLAVVNMMDEIKLVREIYCPFSAEEEYWRGINRTVMHMLDEAGLRDKTVSMGMSFPCGLRVDPDDVTFLYSAQIGAINGMKVSQIRPYFDLPIYVEGEAAAAGYKYCCDHHVDNISYMMINDGIEGALIQDLKIMRGCNGFMALFGHVIIRAGGRRCDCGRRGCLEAYCSTNRLRELNNSGLDLFWERLDGNDADAKEAFDQYLKNLAIGVLNTMAMMDRDVVIGGEIAPILQEHYQELADHINVILAEQKIQDAVRVRFFVDTSDAYGPAIGAAMLQSMRYMSS